jgi:hypothetical protein
MSVLPSEIIETIVKSGEKTIPSMEKINKEIFERDVKEQERIFHEKYEEKIIPAINKLKEIEEGITPKIIKITKDLEKLHNEMKKGTLAEIQLPYIKQLTQGDKPTNIIFTGKAGNVKIAEKHISENIDNPDFLLKAFNSEIDSFPRKALNNILTADYIYTEYLDNILDEIKGIIQTVNGTDQIAVRLKQETINVLDDLKTQVNTHFKELKKATQGGLTGFKFYENMVLNLGAFLKEFAKPENLILYVASIAAIASAGASISVAIENKNKNKNQSK